MRIELVAKVAVKIKDGLTYCKTPPFFPPEVYPEFVGEKEQKLDKENHVYAAVR